MGVSIMEQETTVQISRDSDTAHIWTSDSLMIRKLDKKCAEEGSLWKCTGIQYIQGTKEIVSKQYEVAKRMVTFRAKPAKRRELTDEEKEKLRERILKMQEMRRKQLSGEATQEEMDVLEAEIDELEGDDDEG